VVNIVPIHHVDLAIDVVSSVQGLRATLLGSLHQPIDRLGLGFLLIDFSEHLEVDNFSDVDLGWPVEDRLVLLIHESVGSRA
jgi:hypothetical protein